MDEYSTLVGVQAITAMVETIRYVCSGCGATLIRHYRQCPKPDVTVALKRFYHEHPDLV